MSQRPAFSTYDEFFVFYVGEHRDPRNRVFHAIGTLFGLAILIAAFVLGHPWLALLWLPAAYGFAWVGHFLLERNKPASFSHPLWSFISDFRMLFLMLTGGLEPWLERAAGESQQ